MSGSPKSDDSGADVGRAAGKNLSFSICSILSSSQEEEERESDLEEESEEEEDEEERHNTKEEQLLGSSLDNNSGRMSAPSAMFPSLPDPLAMSGLPPLNYSLADSPLKPYFPG